MLGNSFLFLLSSYHLFEFVVTQKAGGPGGVGIEDLNLEQLGVSFDLGGFSSLQQENGSFAVDSQLASKIRSLIRHFKQDDPLGIPKGIGIELKEPIKVPNLEQTFSGTRMKFENLSLYGVNRFRLDRVVVGLSDLRIGVGLSIDEIFVVGFYQMSSWLTKAKGNFSVRVGNISTDAEVGLMVDNLGVVQVDNMTMDVGFGDIKMNFENLGFLGNIFQGMVNSVGGYLFESIKPLILGEVEGVVRGELNRQARSVPQQFPNSLNPIDTFLLAARDFIREKGLDPFPIPDQYLFSFGSGLFQLTEGSLGGLSTIHRTGPLVLSFQGNVIRVRIEMGAQDLQGRIAWGLELFGIILREGSFQFWLERITVHVEVGQPANLDKPTMIDKVDIELGNIALASDGLGTMDYVLEAAVNIIPNLLRKQIVDVLEGPVRELVQTEILKLVEIEKIIEKHLPPEDEVEQQQL